MSYCVNCGVELDDTAAFCPLCHTPVHNPNQPVNQTAPKPFPTERKEVPPASKLQVAILLSTILASVAVCCGVLNVFLRTQRTWSLYVIGAALMIWIWTVPHCSIIERIPFGSSCWQMCWPSQSMSL